MATGILDSETAPLERDVAQLIGWSRGTAKNFRNEKMVGGIDWRVEGRRVVYLEPGLKKIKKAARTKEIKPPAPVDLIVSRLVINRHIVMACKKKGDLEVRVKVRDAANFKPGMILADCVPEGVHLYSFTGRTPRKKGRW